MNIRKATWEKRNLGVGCTDFFIAEEDGLDAVFAAVEGCEDEYQVAHISGGATEALLYIQDLGFKIIEMNIELFHDLKHIELPRIYKRFEPQLSYHYATDKDIQQVLDCVRGGEMFLTDKVARDPYFGKQKAGIRYYNWCKDIIGQGGFTVMCNYKEDTIGFETYKVDTDGRCTNIIGGVFPEYNNKGLGFAPLYVELLSQKEKGVRKVHTAVSSNNVPVLKVHEMLGYKVDRMSYILIKHI